MDNVWHCNYKIKIKGEQNMKKRIAIVATACPLLLFTTACGSKIPKGMSEQTYNAGMQALEIEESYLNGEITANEAYKQLDIVYDLIDTFEFDDTDESTKNHIVAVYILSFSLDLLGEADATDAHDKLKETLS